MTDIPIEVRVHRPITLGGDLRSGVALFRVRRRGCALERVLCEVLSPAEEPDAGRTLVRFVARRCGADYIIRLGPGVLDRGGFVRVPDQGPVLTWYQVASDPPGRRLGDWTLTRGDVELM